MRCFIWTIPSSLLALFHCGLLMIRPASGRLQHLRDSTNFHASGRSGDKNVQLLTPTCPAELTSSKVLSATLTFYYSFVLSSSDPSSSILCARLEQQSLGWIGFAISPHGSMIGSEAVIGLPDNNSVLKYSLTGKSPDLVIEMPSEKQTLMDAKIVQEGDTTVMEFTKYLMEEGEIAINVNATNRFLFAGSNSNVLGYHNSRGSFVIDVKNSYELIDPQSYSNTIALEEW